MNIKKVIYWNHSNKPRCVFVDNQECQLISIDIWCKAGISFEENNKRGTAHFLEHMIFKGSNKLMPGEFDYKIESFGGSSNASTGYDDSHYYVLVPPDKFSDSLSLLTNLVLLPSINIEEFEKEKSVVIEEIKQQNDQPDEYLFNLFIRKIWNRNIYSNSILGEEESIKNLNLNDLVKFHSNRYSIENISIAISGKLPKNIKTILENCKISLKELTNKKSNNLANLRQKIKRGREIIKFKKLEFSRILLGWQIPNNNNQRLILGFEILASLLADGRNSILTKPLKEETNLVESIYVDVNAGEFGSLLIIEVCCEIKNLLVVERKINELLEDLIHNNNEISKELERAINITKSNYFFNLETPSQLSAFYGNNLLWGRIDPLRRLKENLEYWSNENNFKEILSYLSKGNFTLIVESE